MDAVWLLNALMLKIGEEGFQHQNNEKTAGSSEMVFTVEKYITYSLTQSGT